MSAIGSVSSGSNLFNFLQSLSTGSQSQAPSASSSIAQASSTSSASGANQTQSTAASQIQGQRHHHGHGNRGLFQKIQSAVTSALKAAQSDRSSDPNKIIESAIAQVFKDNGGTPTAPSSPGGPTVTQATGVEPNTSDNASSPADVDAAGNSAQQSFLQSLKSLGVDARQFHQDFLAAIQDAQVGNVNPSTAFQSVPPGATVDTLA